MGDYRYISFRRDREELRKPEPHPDPKGRGYSCGCTCCEQWRAARVWPGRLCRPATQDPSRTSPGKVPAWPINDWGTTGWNFRLEDNGIERVVVVGYIDELDRLSGGHLDCVVVLTHEKEPRLLVTSRKWLVALA